MSNYNTQLQSNNTDLQMVLQTLQTKAAGGEQATPVISVNSSNGLITAVAGTKSATHQLAFQSAKTITPTTASQIAVSSGYYTGGNIIVAGDSNLVADNIKSGINIFGVNGTYSGGSDDGEIVVDDISKAIIEGTITEISNNNVEIIRPYAFASCSSLTTVSFPKARSIGTSAFKDCSSLTTVSFPMVTTISQSAFVFCGKLTTANFPVATTIGSHAFNNCYSLTTANFPVATTMGTSAFINCYSLTTANFPKVTNIKSRVFTYCSRLTTASFPAATSIGISAFTYCRILSQFYLTGSSVCMLTNSSVFLSTPYAGYSSYFSGTPYIYVPSSLLTSYKTATNWTYFSSYFSAVENSPDWNGTYGDTSGSSGDSGSGGGAGGSEPPNDI